MKKAIFQKIKINAIKMLIRGGLHGRRTKARAITLERKTKLNTPSFWDTARFYSTTTNIRAQRQWPNLTQIHSAFMTLAGMSGNGASTGLIPKRPNIRFVALIGRRAIPLNYFPLTGAILMPINGGITRDSASSWL